MLKVPNGQLVQIRALQVKLLMGVVALEAWLDDLDEAYGMLPDDYLQQLPPEPEDAWIRRTSAGYERSEVVTSWAGLRVTLTNERKR